MWIKVEIFWGNDEFEQSSKSTHPLLLRSNENEGDLPAKAPKQVSIKESLGHKLPLPSKKKEEIDCAIEELIIKGLRPLSLVEDPSFINLINVCEPRYTVPARSTIVNRLKRRYEETSSKLKRKLTKIDHCAVTHDTWTSIATQLRRYHGSFHHPRLGAAQFVSGDETN